MFCHLFPFALSWIEPPAEDIFEVVIACCPAIAEPSLPSVIRAMEIIEDHVNRIDLVCKTVFKTSQMWEDCTRPSSLSKSQIFQRFNQTSSSSCREAFLLMARFMITSLTCDLTLSPLFSQGIKPSKSAIQNKHPSFQRRQRIHQD